MPMTVRTSEEGWEGKGAPALAGAPQPQQLARPVREAEEDIPADMVGLETL